ncbi:MAG: hypothetical protein ACKVHP_19175, partial [Verrucomicrobiales bacterium]
MKISQDFGINRKMTWDTHDPIDRGIRALCRHPRSGKILTIVMVAFVGIYGFSLATTSLNRVDVLAPLRAPFNALHTGFQTQQSWGMFYNFPKFSDFEVVIYAGRVGADGKLDAPEALGPILPGFQDLDVAKHLRFYHYFKHSLIADASAASREHFLRTLRQHLTERNIGIENPSTHFGIELVV